MISDEMAEMTDLPQPEYLFWAQKIISFLKLLNKDSDDYTGRSMLVKCYKYVNDGK